MESTQQEINAEDYNTTPVYWFGIPRNVKISGLTMDVDRITHLLAHKDNDHEQWVNYNRVSGARLSAMEHLVPEHKTAGAVLHSEAAQRVSHMDVVSELFSTPENPAHGISAVKAIQLAAAEPLLKHELPFLYYMYLLLLLTLAAFCLWLATLVI